MIEWSKNVVALRSEEEKKNCCVRWTHNCFVKWSLASQDSCMLDTVLSSYYHTMVVVSCYLPTQSSLQSLDSSRQQILLPHQWRNWTTYRNTLAFHWKCLRLESILYKWRLCYKDNLFLSIISTNCPEINLKFQAPHWVIMLHKTFHSVFESIEFWFLLSSATSQLHLCSAWLTTIVLKWNP
jgi:hypothetical protein